MRLRLRTVSSVLYSSLVLGLKHAPLLPGFYGKLVLIETGIEGVCHHCLVCKADQWGCFTL